jgi:hypothetical protein
MGSVLEVGKLVTASWLYRNWKTTGFLLKTYLTISVIILMFITSMGIFGFLSKAHLDQASPVGNNIAKIERIDLRIAREQREIEDAEKVVAQLDEAVNTLIKFEKISGSTGAIAIRKSQNEERQSLRTIVDAAQKTIDKLEDEKFELSSAVREVELEVGPIRYVAELIYDDSSDKLDDAVRWVILILVIVFDPLAVLLLIAANQSLLRARNEKEKRAVEEPKVGTEATADPKVMEVPNSNLTHATTLCDELSNEVPQHEILLDEKIAAPAQKKSNREKDACLSLAAGYAVSAEVSERGDNLLRNEKRQDVVPVEQINGTSNKKRKTQTSRRNSTVDRKINPGAIQTIPSEIQEKQTDSVLAPARRKHPVDGKERIIEDKGVQKKTTTKAKDKKARSSAGKTDSGKSKTISAEIQEGDGNKDKTPILPPSAKIKDGIEPDKVRSPNWIRNKRD